MSAGSSLKYIARVTLLYNITASWVRFAPTWLWQNHRFIKIVLPRKQFHRTINIVVGAPEHIDRLVPVLSAIMIHRFHASRKRYDGKQRLRFWRNQFGSGASSDLHMMSERIPPPSPGPFPPSRFSFMERVYSTHLISNFIPASHRSIHFHEASATKSDGGFQKCASPLSRICSYSSREIHTTRSVHITSILPIGIRRFPI